MGTNSDERLWATVAGEVPTVLVGRESEGDWGGAAAAAVAALAVAGSGDAATGEVTLGIA
jgi:hypothetical protein